MSFLANSEGYSFAQIPAWVGASEELTWWREGRESGSETQTLIGSSVVTPKLIHFHRSDRKAGEFPCL
jgi:hypothetical protein